MSLISHHHARATLLIIALISHHHQQALLVITIIIIISCSSSRFIIAAVLAVASVLPCPHPSLAHNRRLSEGRHWIPISIQLLPVLLLELASSGRAGEAVAHG